MYIGGLNPALAQRTRQLRRLVEGILPGKVEKNIRKYDLETFYGHTCSKRRVHDDVVQQVLPELGVSEDRTQLWRPGVLAYESDD